MLVFGRRAIPGLLEHFNSFFKVQTFNEEVEIVEFIE